MGQFDRQVATAKKLIAKNGIVMNWCRKGAPIIPDANKPWIRENGVPIVAAVPLVFVPESDVKRYMSGFGLERSEVPTGGLFALMGQVAFTPTLMDWITFTSTPNIVYGTVTDPIFDLSPNLTQDILWILRFSV